MFIHTQNRLTFQYSIIMMIFLALFIAIVYFLVTTTLSREQEQQLQLLADQQAEAIKTAFTDGAISQEELDTIHAVQESGTQFFYYVTNTNGQLLFGETAIERLQPELLHLMQGWVPQSNEVRYTTAIINPPKHRPHREGPPRRRAPVQEEQRPINLMITGRAIYQHNQMKGMFYTGKDISFYAELQHRLLMILVTLGCLFLGIALLLSYFMSRRAMVPIRHSFQRQQEFVADASHELRTPLSILHSSLDVLELEENDTISDFSRNVLGNMKGEVKRMTRLVSDLLTLARSDSGSPDLQYEQFDLVPSVEQLVNSTKPLAHSKDIDLHLHTPSELMMYADQERIKQLFYILLDNAIKYTPNGGEVTLTLSTGLYEKRPSLYITVQDTGIGIPPEEQSRIFDRFYRADKNRSRQLGGTGLGLSIAKWIAEAHYGTIQISSTPGQGSVFTAIIPLGPPKA